MKRVNNSFVGIDLTRFFIEKGAEIKPLLYRPGIVVNLFLLIGRTKGWLRRGAGRSLMKYFMACSSWLGEDSAREWIL